MALVIRLQKGTFCLLGYILVFVLFCIIFLVFCLGLMQKR